MTTVGIEPGGAGAERDQRVHLRPALQERRNAGGEEAAAGDGEDKRRQRELQDAVPSAEHHHRPVMEGGHEMAAHLDDDDRQRQRDREREVAAEPLGVVVVMGHRIVRRMVARQRQA